MQRFKKVLHSLGKGVFDNPWNMSEEAQEKVNKKTNEWNDKQPEFFEKKPPSYAKANAIKPPDTRKVNFPNEVQPGVDAMNKWKKTMERVAKYDEANLPIPAPSAEELSRRISMLSPKAQSTLTLEELEQMMLNHQPTFEPIYHTPYHTPFNPQKATGLMIEMPPRYIGDKLKEVEDLAKQTVSLDDYVKDLKEFYLVDDIYVLSDDREDAGTVSILIKLMSLMDVPEKIFQIENDKITNYLRSTRVDKSYSVEVSFQYKEVYVV